MFPRTVLLVESLAPVRNPVVSPATVIKSSLLALVRILILFAIASKLAVTPAEDELILLMTDVSVSVSLLIVIEAPLIAKEPFATEANCVVLEKTCWSSRRFPRTLLLAESFAAVRKPLVSLPIGKLSSLL